MAKPDIRGFAILPPEDRWGEDADRLRRLEHCYQGKHIPIVSIIPGHKAVVDWSVLGEERRWRTAHALAKYFYPNTTPPVVYAQADKGNVLISLKRLTIMTKSPIPEGVLNA